MLFWTGEYDSLRFGSDRPFLSELLSQSAERMLNWVMDCVWTGTESWTGEDGVCFREFKIAVGVSSGIVSEGILDGWEVDEIEQEDGEGLLVFTECSGGRRAHCCVKNIRK